MTAPPDALLTGPPGAPAATGVRGTAGPAGAPTSAARTPLPEMEPEPSPSATGSWSACSSRCPLLAVLAAIPLAWGWAAGLA